ncbi:Thiamine pyrophosphate enzyme, N-terminal TPP binding domain [Streptomyces sp. SceaMP-e96]|nr:Thiamine pyrophosphate enzyme, N-terminal TPP binding domain [Streptomyces sp. SceaMP-e96]
MPRCPDGSPHHATCRPPDLVRLAGPVTKRAERIEDPARLPGAFREAFRLAREGRPGPVLIDVPAEWAVAEIGYDAGAGFRPPRAGPVRGAAPRPPVPASGVPAEIAGLFAPDAHVVSGTAGACARSGPPGWEVPAAIGVRTALDSLGEREAEVVAVIDSQDLPALAEELATAAQHAVPFVLIMLTPVLTPPGHEPDFPDHVKLAEAYGCAGRYLAGSGGSGGAPLGGRVGTQGSRLHAAAGPPGGPGRLDASPPLPGGGRADTCPVAPRCGRRPEHPRTPPRLFQQTVDVWSERFLRSDVRKPTSALSYGRSPCRSPR